MKKKGFSATDPLFEACRILCPTQSFYLPFLTNWVSFIDFCGCFSVVLKKLLDDKQHVFKNKTEKDQLS